MMREKAYQARLDADLAHWIERGLIDADLAERLRNETAPRQEAKRSSALIGFLAAGSVTLGLLTVIAANWPALNGVMRLALLAALFAGTIVGAGFFADRGQRIAAEGLGLIATALVGGALVIIGQLYHTSATGSAFLMTWTLGGLGLALGLSSRAGLALAGILSVAWAIAFQFEAFENAVGPFAVLPVWAILVWIGWRQEWPELVHIVTIGLILWLQTLLMPVGDGEGAVFINLAVRLLIFGGVAAGLEWLWRRRPFWGVRIVIGWCAVTAMSLAFVLLIYTQEIGPDVFKNNPLILPALYLPGFAALAAYGAGAERKLLRNVGVLGFVLTGLFLFSLVDQLLVGGVLLVAFGAVLAGFLWALNRITRQAHKQAGMEGT
jgi:uncharacterized membrane protein